MRSFSNVSDKKTEVYLSVMTQISTEILEKSQKSFEIPRFCPSAGR